jgi:hypothetical protein
VTAPAPRYVDPIERLAIVLWIRIPRAVIRRLPSLWGVAGDGHALVALPPLAVLSPFVVTAGAFVVGAQRLGYEVVYTESIAIMAAAIAIGAFSSQLGLLAVLGFGLGEQLVDGRRSIATSPLLGAGERFGDGLLGTFARVRLPMVITYLLLAVAVVVIPRTARALLVAVGRWRRVPASIAWPLASGLFVVVVWIALRTWVAAAPTLVRPRFTWTGGLPTVKAIQPIQDNGDELIAAGVMAAMARQVLLGLALWWSPVRDRVRFAEEDRVPERAAQAGRARPVASGTFRRLLGDVGAAGLATIVLAGVLEEGWLWVAAFAVFLAVRLLRSGVIAAGALDTWKLLVARVPAVARAVLLWIVARVVTDALVKGFIDSYTGVALVVIAGAVMVFLIFPGTPRVAVPPEGAGPSSGPAPAPAPAGGA